MSDERVLYNGVLMSPEWRAIIEKAQQVSHYWINGEWYPRIRFGDEEGDWGADRGPCHDCSVVKGQYHVGPLCDVERCPRCGGQVVSCDCEYEDDEERKG
jgi:hypothetical protein